jgi:predicted PurR-regulated permease PerM
VGLINQKQMDTIKKNFNTLFLLAFIILIGILVYLIFKPFITAALIAFLFSYFFTPLYNKINHGLKNKKSLSAFIVCLVVLLFFLIPATIIIIIVINQANNLSNVIVSNDWVSKLGGFLEWINNSLDKPFINNYLPFVREYFSFDKQSLTDFVSSDQFKGGLQTTGNFTYNLLIGTYKSTTNFILMTFVMFFSLFYFLKDRDKIINKILRLTPLKDKQERLLIDRFVSVSKATLRGTLVIAIIQGTLTGIIFALTGVPSAALLGLIAVFFALIPMVGAGIVWAPVGIIMILTGYIWQGLLILILGALVVSTVDNLLRPKLVGDSASLHPLLVFFSTLGGLFIFGVMGFLIGPIIVVLFMTLLQIYEMEFKKELKNFNQ